MYPYNNFNQNDFNSQGNNITSNNQRYFGDWVSYHGRGDVGYYLGAKFVQKLRDKYSFEQLIKMSIDDIYQEYLMFVESKL